MPLIDILNEAVSREASDVLIIAGLPVSYKVSGRIDRVGERLFPDHTQALAQELYELARRPMDRFLEVGDDDFSFAVPGLSRFRVNALRQRGSLALVIRVVSFSLPDRNALGIPDNVMAFANAPTAWSSSRPGGQRQDHHPGLPGGRGEHHPGGPRHHHRGPPGVPPPAQEERGHPAGALHRHPVL